MSVILVNFRGGTGGRMDHTPRIVALGVFALLYFVLNIGVDLALFPVFFIIMIFAAGSVMQINGTSALKWILTILKGNISRPYESKGVKDRYEEE